MRRVTIQAAIVLTMLATLAACTSNEEKVRRVVEQGLNECKQKEGDFVEVTLFEGTDEVLRAACDRPIEGLELKDEYHAVAKTGPYDWLVGIDSETGVWVLTQVSWETLAQARRAIAGEDPPKDARQRAETLFAEAQKTMPESAWIRLTRLENLLELRKVSRGSADDPTALDDATREVYEATLTWAEENDRPDVAAKARVAVIDYFRSYRNKLEMAFENVGSQDEWLESAIKQAEKEGNKEDAQKYRKTLEEDRATREQRVAEMEQRIAALTQNACRELQSLDPNRIGDGEIKQQAIALKEATSCAAAPGGQ